MTFFLLIFFRLGLTSSHFFFFFNSSKIWTHGLGFTKKKIKNLIENLFSILETVENFWWKNEKFRRKDEKYRKGDKFFFSIFSTKFFLTLKSILTRMIRFRNWSFFVFIFKIFKWNRAEWGIWGIFERFFFQKFPDWVYSDQFEFTLISMNLLWSIFLYLHQLMAKRNFKYLVDFFSKMIDSDAVVCRKCWGELLRQRFGIKLCFFLTWIFDLKNFSTWTSNEISKCKFNFYFGH